MSSSLAMLPSPGSSGSPGEQASTDLASTDHNTVRVLQSRIVQMQRRRLETTALPTLPAFAGLFPDGALHTGTAYAVADSMTLLMGLLAGPSGSGAWCGVVGVPEFGVEAAARLGIDLDRLVLIPHPGKQWLTVTAALADTVTVVVTRPAARVSDADAARLEARLRQRGSALIALGDWPRIQTRLAVTQSGWSGLGRGHGYPKARRVTVTSTGRGGEGLTRSARLWLPDEGDAFRIADPVPVPDDRGDRGDRGEPGERRERHLFEAVG